MSSCLMSRWRPGLDSAPACASSKRPAGWDWRWSSTAMSIPATILSSRITCSAISPTNPSMTLVLSSAAVPVRPAQKDQPAGLLPRLRGALYLQRRLPERPLVKNARQRTRLELFVRRLPGFFQLCRPPDEVDGGFLKYPAPTRGNHESAGRRAILARNTSTVLPARAAAASRLSVPPRPGWLYPAPSYRPPTQQDPA